MILTFDIGNTNVVLGGYENNKLTFVSRFSTNINKTADEYGALINSILNLNKCSADKISGAIISSVVPALNFPFKKAIEKIKPVKTMIVGPGIKTGLNIKIDNPAQLGADFVCSSVAALQKYPLPTIVIDLGTATKISAINKNGEMIGGSIMPGVMISLDALTQRTAQLPQISLDDNVKTIGANTIDCMKSGVILGTASLIDGMISRYRKELGDNLTVIATGGLSKSIIRHCNEPLIYDENLILDGLKIIYDKN